MTSQHLAIFGVDWSNISGDLTYLSCQVTSQDHAIEVPFDIMSRSFSLYVTTLPSLLAKGFVIVKRYVFNLSHDLQRPCESSVM